jgi:hypothetical protein
MTIAATACQNVSPKNSTAMIPTKIVANSMFGDTHVQNICEGLPCRSSTGIGSAPPGSTAVALLPYSCCSSSRDGLAVMGHPSSPDRLDRAGRCRLRLTVGGRGPRRVTAG